MKPTQKTQIEIPTQLHRRVKVRAIQDETTLSGIVNQALEAFFKAGSPTAVFAGVTTPRRKKGGKP